MRRWQYIPQVDFSELSSLSKDEVARIRRVGSVIIRNMVEDDVAVGYKEALKEYVKANPQVDGFPEGNKQFFEMYVPYIEDSVIQRLHGC